MTTELQTKLETILSGAGEHHQRTLEPPFFAARPDIVPGWANIDAIAPPELIDKAWDLVARAEAMFTELLDLGIEAAPTIVELTQRIEAAAPQVTVHAADGFWDVFAYVTGCQPLVDGLQLLSDVTSAASNAMAPRETS